MNFIFFISLAKADTTCHQLFSKNTVSLSYAEKIVAQSKKVQRPAVVFDLDDTVFFVAPRILAALRAYDEARQTSFFAHVDVESIRSESINAFIKEIIFKSLKDRPNNSDIFLDAQKFIQAFFHTSKNLRLDFVNEELAEKIRLFNAHGIQIIYLTGRWEMQRDVSQEMLQKALLPMGELLLAPGKTTVAAFKKSRIEELKALGLDILAVFDDNSPNLIAIQSLGLNIDLYKIENENLKMILSPFE